MLDFLQYYTGKTTASNLGHLDSECGVHLDEDESYSLCTKFLNIGSYFNKSGHFHHEHFVVAILLMFTLNFVIKIHLNFDSIIYLNKIQSKTRSFCLFLIILHEILPIFYDRNYRYITNDFKAIDSQD
jgi:hypothetical protein